MQTLWSRTLRAKCTCRCAQCLSYYTTVARRVTTATGRRALPLPSSTILYSAIFAFAAVADGHAKQQRRETMECRDIGSQRGIGAGDNGKDGAHSRLGDGKEAGAVDDEAAAEEEGFENFSTAGDAMSDVVDPEEFTEDPEASVRGTIQGTEYGRYAVNEEEMAEWEAAQTYSMLRSGGPEWVINFGPDLVEDNLAPQSIYASDSRKMEGLQSRWTRRKIQTMNLSMAKLILRLVRATQLCKMEGTLKMSWIPLDALPPSLRQVGRLSSDALKTIEWHINEELFETKTPPAAAWDRIPEYKGNPAVNTCYEQDAEGEFHRKCYFMNRAIFKDFEHCFSGEINFRTLVARICDNLLTSTAPPNITTYNALILGFLRLQQPKLCDFVIESLHEVHMRPDEITCCAVLNHHAKTDNNKQFTRFIRLMTGMTSANYALMLARPNLLPPTQNTARLNNRVLRHPTSPHKLIQKVYPTSRVFNAIIAGTLKFNGLERAIDICANLSADGWGFDTVGLTHFLAACAELADWEAGSAVWKQLQILRAHRPAHRPLEQRTYLHMLGLCWRCGQQDAFDAVLREATTVAGYRGGVLLKMFDKMQRCGFEFLGDKARKSDEWQLRRDVAAKLAAEGELLFPSGGDGPVEGQEGAGTERRTAQAEGSKGEQLGRKDYDWMSSSNRREVKIGHVKPKQVGMVWSKQRQKKGPEPEPGGKDNCKSDKLDDDDGFSEG